MTASHTLQGHPRLDILVVPGGLTHEMERNEKLINWLVEATGDAVITASVCIGAFLLATAGLLDGR